MSPQYMVSTVWKHEWLVDQFTGHKEPRSHAAKYEERKVPRDRFMEGLLRDGYQHRGTKRAGDSDFDMFENESFFVYVQECDKVDRYDDYVPRHTSHTPNEARAYTEKIFSIQNIPDSIYVAAYDDRGNQLLEFLGKPITRTTHTLQNWIGSDSQLKELLMIWCEKRLALPLRTGIMTDLVMKTELDHLEVIGYFHFDDIKYKTESWLSDASGGVFDSSSDDIDLTYEKVWRDGIPEYGDEV